LRYLCSHTHIQTGESLNTSVVSAISNRNIARMANKAFVRGGKCKWCGSHEVVRNGIKDGQQLLRCKECKHQFYDNGKLPRMRKSKEALAHSLEMFYDGTSLRKTKRQVRKFLNEYVAYNTIWTWIDRYTPMVKRYLSNFRPNLSGLWHADETALKFRGEQCWHWDAIDKGTRFLVGNHISRTRGFDDAETFFKDCACNTPRPQEIVTDSLHTYHRSINSIYYSRYKPRRVRHKKIRHVKENILIERWHGTLKDRTNSMRGLKSPNTKIPDGFVIHYNFLREHESLDGNTPAKEAEIDLPFEDGWGDLIHWSLKWHVICQIIH
jgi:putative transposase